MSASGPNLAVPRHRRHVSYNRHNCQTRASQHGKPLNDSLDHFTRKGEQPVRDLQAERVGGLKVKHELDLGGLRHR